MKSSRAAQKFHNLPFRRSRQLLIAQQKRFISAGQTHLQNPLLKKKYVRGYAGAFVLIAFGANVLLDRFDYGYPRSLHAEEVVPTAEITFEKPRRKTASKEENRDLLSSQHLQVKRSWESPGVYAWGSNSGRVVAPDSDESVIKTPRRISFFDGKVIRDIKLATDFAAAIDDKGDLLQWGKSFSPTCTGPTPTLNGKDLVKITISKDRIIALASNGSVYSVSASQNNQISGPKQTESSWFPFWNWSSSVSYKNITPTLAWGEKVKDVSSGLEHCLLLTSAGRVFSVASGTEDFPSKGQLGIAGLTWTTRPEGPYDQPIEIQTLKGFEITKVATGDFHSLVLDKTGRVFAFGDNSSGQLGFDVVPELPTIDVPSLVAIDKLYRGSSLTSLITNIAAGGRNSFFFIDAKGTSGSINSDVWTCGQGILGTLGTGRWTHVQDQLTKIKALSGLSEYDEEKNIVVPIRLAHLSVGSTHASAILDNTTHIGASDRGSENETNWGSDVLWWGGNEFYQLGSGKRNNVNTPTYIPPLDIEADVEKGRREEHRFQITPRKIIKFNGKRVSVEQSVECGRGVSAVYSKT